MEGVLADWRDALGLLSVLLAVLAAVITIAQTLRGEVRPHPLSWFLFGVLSLTGYWVQRDQGDAPGQLDASGNDDHLLSVCRCERRPRRAKLHSYGMGVRRRGWRGVRLVHVHSRRQCRGRADDGHRR